MTIKGLIIILGMCILSGSVAGSVFYAMESGNKQEIINGLIEEFNSQYTKLIDEFDFQLTNITESNKQATAYALTNISEYFNTREDTFLTQISNLLAEREDKNNTIDSMTDELDQLRSDKALHSLLEKGLMFIDDARYSDGIGLAYYDTAYLLYNTSDLVNLPIYATRGVDAFLSAYNNFDSAKNKFDDIATHPDLRDLLLDWVEFGRIYTDEMKNACEHIGVSENVDADNHKATYTTAYNNFLSVEEDIKTYINDNF